MIAQNAHFIVIAPSEIVAWLKKQKVTRRINVLQVHHTWVPNYSTFKGNYLSALESMRTSHLGRGFSDIAQQFSVFPDGMIGISLGRTLNDAPAGIKGLNANAICIENIANFDKGGDTMSLAQREGILTLYAALADRFDIPVDTAHLVYHHWMSAAGRKAFDFVTGKATGETPAKTCPGTAFWGKDNTVAGANAGFIPDVRAKLAQLKSGAVPAPAKPIIKEEDLPMTATEKKAFDELVATVTAQGKTIAEQSATITTLNKQLEDVKKLTGPLDKIPAWAEGPLYRLKNIKYDGKNVIIDTITGGTNDFYRMAAIVDRVVQYLASQKK